MKKILTVALMGIALVACTGKRGVPVGEWEVIVSGDWNYSALYRYVDKEYGVIVYIGDNYRMTSQKIK